MAQLTKGTGNSKPKLCNPFEYSVIDVGKVTEDIDAGELAVLGASGWSLAGTSVTEAHGVALKDYKAGQDGCDFGIQCEMDGFGDNLTPGAVIYPSASVAGGMQTDARTTTLTDSGTDTVDVPFPVRIRAVTATRLRFNFV